MDDRESLEFVHPDVIRWSDTKSGLCFIAMLLCVAAWAVIKWLS